LLIIEKKYLIKKNPFAIIATMLEEATKDFSLASFVYWYQHDHHVFVLTFSWECLHPTNSLLGGIYNYVMNRPCVTSNQYIHCQQQPHYKLYINVLCSDEGLTCATLVFSFYYSIMLNLLIINSPFCMCYAPIQRCLPVRSLV
jgi:hypothetical protein